MAEVAGDDGEFLGKLPGYSEGELVEILEGIDRRRYPERYLGVIDELDRRGHYAGGMTEVEHAAMRPRGAGGEFRRFRMGCLVIWFGVVVLVWLFMWLG